jgi:hypothetical protein
VSTAQSKGDQRPALLLRVGHQRREVEHRPAEAVELGDNEAVSLAARQSIERGLDAGSLEVACRAPSVLDHLDDVPTSPLALGDDRMTLCLQPGAAIGLLIGRNSAVA